MMEKDQVKNQAENQERKLRWGILGAGGIVNRWIRGAKQLKDEMEIVGIASRTIVTYIYGTKGYMVIPVFWKPTQVQIICGTSVEELEMKVPQNVPGMEDEGYQYEIAHVNDCVRKDLKESPVMPPALTEMVLKQCDSLRKQWGLIYPSER